MYDICLKKGIIFVVLLLLILPIYSPASKINEIDRITFNEIISENNNLSSDTITNSLIMKILDLECYGFIIPIPPSSEIADMPEIQYNLFNLINNLLRNQIPVYWIPHNIELLTKKIFLNEFPEPENYNKGSFIVPFTGDSFLDTMSIVIISEFCYTNDTHKEHTLSSEVSIIMEPLQDVKLYQLNEPRIAFYFDEGVTTRCINWYISSLSEAGFIKIEILDDHDIICKLNNQNFNVLVWPGGVWPWENMFESLENKLSFVPRLVSKYVIKQFVSNGGGFVGSCYGAYIASSGMRFTPFFFMQYHHPKMPSIGFLSISDTLLALALPSTINITIEETDSPVTFGLNGTLSGSLLQGGPVFTWLGKNSESLATIEDINLSWLYWLDSMNSSLPKKIIKYWANFTTGKTIWASSNYKKGKIVTFGDHPEHGDITLQRAVHNSVFYVTSQSLENQNVNHYYPISFLENTVRNSLNITLYEHESDVFKDIYKRIIHVAGILNSVENQYDKFSVLIDNLTAENKMELSFSYQIRRGGLWEFKEFIHNSINYLNDSQGKEDTINHLGTIDSISNMLSLVNVSIEEDIYQLKNEITDRLNKINDSINSLNDHINQLIYEIQHYQNTTAQNEYILTIVEKIKITSEEIGKYIPLIYFDTLILSRDSWYIYKTLAVNN